jgi:hypothetical protein
LGSHLDSGFDELCACLDGTKDAQMNGKQDGPRRFDKPAWSRRFDKPIEISDGGKIETLRDALAWLARAVPKAEHGMKDVQSAVNHLREAAENNGPMMFAEISLVLVINRLRGRESNASREATHSGRRKAPLASPSLRIPRVVEIASRTAMALTTSLRSLRLSIGRTDKAPPVSPAVLNLLKRVQASGGAVYWKEGNEPHFDGLNDAIDLGCVVRLSGATHEGITITKTGRQALGLESAPSFLKKMAGKIRISR